MPFKTILKELTENIGARGAVMVDWEGELVDSSGGPGATELALAGAHYELVFKTAHDAGGEAGTATEMEFTTGDTRVGVYPLKEGYCLVVVAENTPASTKMRHEAKIAVRRLEEEMG